MDALTEGPEPYVPVVIQEHIFRHDLKRKCSKPGLRVSEILQEHDLPPDQVHALVMIDDRPVEQTYWHLVKPKAGHVVTIRVIPQGSGAQGKDVLRIVGMVGVMALAIATAVFLPPLLPAFLGGAASTIGALAGIGVTIGGSLRITTLVSSPPRLEVQ
jgi:hypothetical protein